MLNEIEMSIHKMKKHILDARAAADLWGYENVREKSKEYWVTDQTWGGMSDIYKAIDKKTDRTVIIKTSNSSQNEKYIKNEAQLLGALSHPHVPTLYDTFFHDGHEHLVLEYIPDSIADYFGRNLTEDTLGQKVFSVVDQINATLFYLEEFDIVHSDVKPDNIRFAGQKSMLLDFGLSGKQLTIADGQPYGTLTYLSPEAAHGDAHTSKSDVFALGMSAAILLDRYNPKDVSERSLCSLPNTSEYGHGNYRERFKFIQEGELASLMVQRIKPRFNPRLVELIETSLSLREDARPDAFELQERINHVRGEFN